MKSKLLQGILIGLAVVFILVNPLIMGILAIPAWIYLVVKLRKNGSSLFDAQIVSESKQRSLKKIKQLLTTAAILFPISWTAIILHQVPEDISENLASVFFFVGVAALYGYIFTTAMAVYLFLKVRKAEKIAGQ